MTREKYFSFLEKHLCINERFPGNYFARQLDYMQLSDNV